jgi:hypothetical protein
VDALTRAQLLIQSGAPALLVRSTAGESVAVATFGYRDLNQFLLFATGSLRPEQDQIPFVQELAKKSRLGQKIPLRDVKGLGAKDPFVTLSQSAKLTKAVEMFGGGVPRIVIVRDGTGEVVGILSQLRLVKFLWENGKSFPILDQLYSRTIQDLTIGSRQVISIK